MDRTINIKIPCMNDLFRHNGKWSSQVSFVFDAAAFLLLVCGWTESRLAAGLVPGSVQKVLTILQEKEIPDPWQRLCLYRLKNSQTYPLINKSATFTAKKNSLHFCWIPGAPSIVYQGCLHDCCVLWTKRKQII